MTDYIHPSAIVETKKIGKGTTIWAFVHVLQHATIGGNVNICDHCFIENNVKIGDNVTIKCGVFLWDGITLEDNVFIGPSATFTNDLLPRSKNKDYKQEKTLVRVGASIGANATILAGITIGQYALIGAGAVVTKDVPDFALVYGNPGKVNGYVCVCGKKMDVSKKECICSCGKTYDIQDNKVSLRV